MSEMEKTKKVVLSVLNASRLGEIEKIKLLNRVAADIQNEFEEVESVENKISEYWLICYQMHGFMSVKNAVLKDEHPIRYIARKNGENDDQNIYYLVNFWEIDQEKYDELTRCFLDL
jgi:hypothetical protein